jgi:peroxiredoxin
MQSAVTRYKDDPNVVFLFIHTWERGDSAATENARKYIQEKKYPFEVLMDLQDATTGINKVVESYKVTGIPTKFVIDGSGNIRFRFTGFSGGEDAAVEEVSAMIELARNNKK